MVNIPFAICLVDEEDSISSKKGDALFQVILFLRIETETKIWNSEYR